MKPFSSLVRRHWAGREALIFLAFMALTIVMTWPWITHLRDAATDPGDPYFSSWVLWWDYHQTFHDPLNLFHGNIFYPYRYSLAFSEHDYGIALLFFPLFALGLRPLTVHGIATLFGFAFSGYGAFRLTRTLTASSGAAWIAGITFAFIPYRFGQLPHLIYVFAGWIPILLEALVLFAGGRTTKHAVWLGIAFFMNGLTCIHWFLLTLIPLAVSGVFLLVRYRAWRDAALWRGAGALAVAAAGLLLFLIPYSRAAALYGFVRNPGEALFYSATPLDWLVGEYRNKIWSRLNESIRAPERALFPGLLPLLLTLSAFFLVEPLRTVGSRLSHARRLVVLLDAALIICAILMITITGFGYYKLRILSHYLLELSSLPPVIAAFVIILFTRVLIAYPEVIKRLHEIGIVASWRANARSDAFWLGVIWAVVGFLGSLGMNFGFHRFLYKYVSVFRSIRVPARWAMICCIGLALLAAVGTLQLTELFRRHWPRIHRAPIYVLIALALLVEQNSAPVILIHGAVDPDDVTIRLSQTPMSGGIVELPALYGGMPNYYYVLRAADHTRPLVTAMSGFLPPLEQRIEALTQQRPIPDEFIDLLESIPCSYLVVHNGFMGPADRAALESFLARGITAERMRFIRSYDGADLYAVTRTEPKASSEANPPFLIQPVGRGSVQDKDIHLAPEGTSHNAIDDARFFVRMQYLDFLGREPDPDGLNYWTGAIQRCGKDTRCAEEQRVTVSAAFFAEKEFQETGFFVHRLYRATLGRAPSYAEFKTDRAKLLSGANLEAGKEVFLADWVKGPLFLRLYSSQLTSEQFVDALLRTVRETSSTDLGDRRQSFVDEVERSGSRARLVRQIADDETLVFAEHNRAFVSMQYFGYLNRDPDPQGYAFWVDALGQPTRDADREMVRTFVTSKEYRSRFLR